MCGCLQWIGIVCAIEDVEEFRAELNVEVLTKALYMIVLDQGHVEVLQSRSVDGVTSGISQEGIVACGLGWIAEATGVDIVNLVLLVDRVATIIAIGEAEGI